MIKAVSFEPPEGSSREQPVTQSIIIGSSQTISVDLFIFAGGFNGCKKSKV
jgi:hypothetical protein